MKRLQELLREQSRDTSSNHESKRLQSSRGTVAFVPAYEVDYEFQNQRTRTEPILPDTPEYHLRHHGTLRRVTRNAIEPAINKRDNVRKTIQS